MLTTCKNIHRYLTTGLFLLFATVHASAQSTSGNPLFPGWYADPDVVIAGSQYWIFPTFSAQYEDQVFMDAFSSKDMIHWVKHHAVIDTSKIKWARKAMWAPCMISKNNKYYLFFSANDIQTPERKGLDTNLHHEKELGGIGIGISDSPGGPYRDYLGKPLINDVYNKAQPIDQDVFRDINNQYYLIYGGWGHCNIARLDSNFAGLVPFPDGKLVKEITPRGYVEGPAMFLRKGKYYLMWSEGNWTDESYKVAYGISDSPLGPFEKRGTILKTDSAIATGAGHHSILNIPGTDDWYIVYHRRPIPNKGRDHRVVCMDKMYFDKNGDIKNVKMTVEGVEKRDLQ